jgi:class 3 adenylate cyclase/DNA-binding response OmpR family regulator
MSVELKRILLMEDSDILAEMLISAFDNSKYLIQRASNGFEGIKKVYEFLPHLIISDIEMPLFKGYQVTRFLKSRKNTKPIPIILFTSLDETKDKFWGSQAGADFYIEKSPDNLAPLFNTIEKIFSSPPEIDYDAIEKESRKINDNSIIEIVNNLLDNKLFQTTIIGLLSDLSEKVHSIEITANGILNLLHTVCEGEIITLMIRGSRGFLYIYTANFSGYSKEIHDNFLEICSSDFNKLFPDKKITSKEIKSFHSTGQNKKNISSYYFIPLTASGVNFASIHIANSINDYFTSEILENINVFSSSASPIIANALSLQELAELQNNTRTAFARYVPADVMDELINETTKKRSLSENRKVSVLFCDIRDFTNMAEHSNAQDVVDFLNDFFAKMGSEIISEGGHVDKFIGDAIMAVFGAFQNNENSPANSIKAAVKMLSALENINSTETAFTADKVKIGIGINYGECILGNIGFKNKMDYTIIGDTVNLASRLENLTKIYHHPLIVSEALYEEVKERFLFRKIDNVCVKGKDKPVGIYAVYSGFHGANGKKLRSGETADILSVNSLLINRETLVNFNKGQQVFYLREWKLAQEYFNKALENDKNDYLSKLYLERSQKHLETPVEDDWDGVITLSEK